MALDYTHRKNALCADSSRRAHDRGEGGLELLHFMRQSHCDAYVGGPDGPGASDVDVLGGHGGDDFLAVASCVDHEAVRNRRYELVVIRAEPVEGLVAYGRDRLLAGGNERGVFH